MSRLYQFVVGITDKATGTMDRLDAKSRGIQQKLDRATQAGNRLQNNFNKTGRTGTTAFNKVDGAIGKKNKSLRTAVSRSDQLRQQTNRLNHSMGGLGSTLKRLAGLMGVAFLIHKVVGFTKSIIGLGAELESTEVAFATLLGSQQKALNMIDDLNEFANATPFENRTLQEGAKLLLNFGTAGEDILPTLKMLGDISGGNTEKFNSLNLAFAQMSSTGRLMGQDLLQMINAGFNPLQIISEKTGRSMADLKKDMEGGAISAEMVKSAFMSATQEGGRFFRMMEKQSQTTNGLISTLRGKLQLIFMEVGRGSEGLTKGVLRRLISFIDTNRERIMGFFQRVGRGVEQVFEWISDLINTLRPFVIRITTAFSGLWSSIMTLIGTVFSLQGAGEGLNQVLDVMTAIIESAIGTTRWLIEVLTANWFWMKKVAIGVGIVVVALKAWKIAQIALNIAMMANPIGIVIALIGGLVAAIVWAWDNSESFRGAIMGLWEATKQVFTNMANIVSNFVKETFLPFLEAWDNLKKGNIGKALMNLGEGTLGVVLSPVRLMNGIVEGIGEGVGDAFGSGFRDGYTQVRENKMQKQMEDAASAQQRLSGGGGSDMDPQAGAPAGLESGMEAITGGGSKQTHITINLRDLIGEFNMNPQTVEQGADEMVDVVLNRLLRVLNSANNIATR